MHLEPETSRSIMRASSRRRTGFTLIELVVLVVIIAIVAAIAIPKMSSGSGDAADSDSAVAHDLATMRAAIDLYQTEHRGRYPSGTSATKFLNQLMQHTDSKGNAQDARDSRHAYGPYLKSIPALPVGTNKGLSTVTVTGPAGTGAFGWYFDGTTVWANDPIGDADGRTTPYNTY
jgi:prepilin-type N-terminal cleavage/methylation domain-containing protein